MKRFKLLVLLIFVLLSNVSFAAFKIPEKAQDYVSDYANVLSAQQERELNSYLRSFDDQSSNQLVIAVFDSLQGESLEDISIRIAEKWQPGTAERDNGVLVTVFISDRKIRIEVGYGLEDKLTDAVCAGLIDQIVKPAFRRGDYYAGLYDLSRTISSISFGELDQEDLKVYTRNQREESSEYVYFLALLIFIIFKVVMQLAFGRSRGYSSHGYYGGTGGYFSSGGGSSFGGFSGGGGSFGGGGASGGW